MTCNKCQDINDVPENSGFYVVRTCENCGREMRIREPGAHGIGFKVKKGDRIAVTPGWLKIAANPLKSTGSLSPSGLAWFSKLVFVGNLEKDRSNFVAAIDQLENEIEETLKNSPLLFGFDLQDAEHADAVYDKLKENEGSSEWWLYLSAFSYSEAREAISDGKAEEAAWAIAAAERFRSLSLFKEHFEEVVWMGHSAKKLLDLLALWQNNQTNSDEEFWQIQFQNHSLALSQLFSVPVTLIEGKAYVGGQGVDRRDARIVDFLFSGGSANEAILVEIKTPVTPLMLKSDYRGNVYAPTSHLTGSVIQVMDYRNVFSREIEHLIRGKHELTIFNPKCIVIIGNSAELKNEKQRRSFEIFRSGLANVEVITFDEVFSKIERLATLFSLTSHKSGNELNGSGKAEPQTQ